MTIHLCIESTNNEESKETLESIKKYDGKITAQTYSNTSTDIRAMWAGLSKLEPNTYLLFLKEGDKLILPNLFDDLSTNIDVYFLLNDKIESYPHIETSPFALSNFYKGKYNNYNFLIKAGSAARRKPDLLFGKAWLIDIVMSLLYVDNAEARELHVDILSQESPSLADCEKEREVRLKIIPAKYGYLLSDMMIIDAHGAKNRYRNSIKHEVRKMSKWQLLLKSIFKAKKYKLLYRGAIFKSKYADNWNNIPIVINNFNRLEYLTQLIDSLTKRGATNIHILDNNSTYPPLLEFYKTTPHKVHYLGENLGYRALWKSKVYDLFKDDYYAYTDPDLTICDECPDNFMEFFMNLHQKYNTIWKVGFSLKIYDLPTCFSKRREVQQWEKQFQEIEVEKDVYYAAIDTTFAIYKPFAVNDNNRSLRVGGMYGMHHLPWYIDSDNLSAEDKYYFDSCTQLTHWSVFK